MICSYLKNIFSKINCDEFRFMWQFFLFYFVCVFSLPTSCCDRLDTRRYCSNSKCDIHTTIKKLCGGKLSFFFDTDSMQKIRDTKMTQMCNTKTTFHWKFHWRTSRKMYVNVWSITIVVFSNRIKFQLQPYEFSSSVSSSTHLSTWMEKFTHDQHIHINCRIIKTIVSLNYVMLPINAFNKLHDEQRKVLPHIIAFE